MIDKAFAQSEYDHARLQRDEANQAFARAQQLIAEGQQAAQRAQAAALIADGMVQQAKAFLDKFLAEKPKEAKP